MVIKMADKKKSIENYFSELDKIIEELENPDVSLEKSFEKYRKGMDLLKECNSSIDRIEKELIILEENR